MAVEQHVARFRLDQPVEAAQQCRFSGARRADDAGDRAGLDLQPDLLQHLQLAIGHVQIAHFEAAGLDGGLCGAGCGRACCVLQLTDLDETADDTARLLLAEPQAIVDGIDNMGQRHRDDEIEHAGQQQR